jgi:hypothetical protein
MPARCRFFSRIRLFRLLKKFQAKSASARHRICAECYQKHSKHHPTPITPSSPQTLPRGSHSGMPTTSSIAAKAPPLCPIRSRKPLSRVSWQRIFDRAEPVHALVASLQTPEGKQFVGLMHDLFHRSPTRLNDVRYLQDLIAPSLPLASRPAHRRRAHSSRVCRRCTASQQPRLLDHPNHQHQRPLYDKLANHAGFIVYSHEL